MCPLSVGGDSRAGGTSGFRRPTHHFIISQQPPNTSYTGTGRYCTSKQATGGTVENTQVLYLHKLACLFACLLGILYSVHSSLKVADRRCDETDAASASKEFWQRTSPTLLPLQGRAGQRGVRKAEKGPEPWLRSLLGCDGVRGARPDDRHRGGPAQEGRAGASA